MRFPRIEGEKSGKQARANLNQFFSKLMTPFRKMNEAAWWLQGWLTGFGG